MLANIRPPFTWCRSGAIACVRDYSAFTRGGTPRLPARAKVGHERNVTQMTTPIVTEVRRGSPYAEPVAYLRAHDHHDDERPAGLPDRRGLRRGLRAYGPRAQRRLPDRRLAEVAGRR